MLSSAIEILKHFAPELLFSHHFGYFEIIRVDVEDVFYLCEIHGSWFLVFETDYIVNIRRTYDEAIEIFGKDFVIEGWIPVDAPESRIDPKESALPDNELIRAIAFQYPGNSRYYSTITLTSREPIMQSSSTAYGGFTTV